MVVISYGVNFTRSVEFEGYVYRESSGNMLFGSLSLSLSPYDPDNLIFQPGPTQNI